MRASDQERGHTRDRESDSIRIAHKSNLPRPGGDSGRAGELHADDGERGALAISERTGDASLSPFLHRWLKNSIQATFGELDRGPAAMPMNLLAVRHRTSRILI